MVLHTYYEHLKALPITPERETVLKAIQHGKAKMKNSEFTSLMLSLQFASRAVPAISDLSLLILRNQTTTPFILGDTPCVFSNHYMRSIKNYGVLGFLTPGLMIALPIDPRTQILFYDDHTYKPDYSTKGCIDVFNIKDVSILNALQIHSAENNVYFSDVSVQPYIRDILSAHRSILQDHQGEFVIHTEGKVLIDGTPSKGETLHVYERQLPVTLDLSFMSTKPLLPNENLNRPRNPDLASQVQQSFGMPNEARPIGIDKFVKWVESEIDISET